MSLIDTHCHINLPEFKDDAPAVIDRARALGVSLVAPGVERRSSLRAVAYAQKYDGIWAAVGLHPVQLFDIKVVGSETEFHTRAEEFDPGFYRDLGKNPRVVAIGEVGLDYKITENTENTFFRPRYAKTTSGEQDFGGPTETQKTPESAEAMIEKQKHVFKRQLLLARKLAKPVIVHTRSGGQSFDVFVDALELMDQTDYHNCVLHSFAGNWTQAQVFLAAGCLLSFTGVITFKNAQATRAVVAATPLDRMMIETDSPYLAPEPYRGKRNEPSYVKYVAEKIAAIKGISFEEVARVTTENAQKFFKLL